MELWLDTTNRERIEFAHRLGIIHGVTTNPTLVARTGRPLEKILEQIFQVHEGPVAVQVTAENTEGMIAQGQNLHAFSDQIIVKVPMSCQGLEALNALSRNGILTMATAVFHPNQMLLASLAGANYVAPYLSHMQHAGIEAFEALSTMMTMSKQNGWTTKILAASIVKPDQVCQCAELGVHAITVKDEIFDGLVEEHELTVESIARFAQNWESAAPTKLLMSGF